jgi:TatD DNase family protein
LYLFLPITSKKLELTDSHTHLYSDEFREDLDRLLEAAATEGITRFFMPNIDSASIEDMLAVEQRFPGKCFSMMGLHPCSVKENWKDEMRIVEEWLTKRKFAAIGEIGIDLYWDKTFIEEQKLVFKRQMELAVEYRLPIVIHTRDSFDITYGLVRDFNNKGLTGVFHCFTGNAEQARMVIELGFYMGIGGVVTFKNGELDKVLPEIDLKDIVLETDAPYLAPVPFRGKRNEPYYLKKIAEKIAEIKNISVEEVAAFTTANAKKLFNM